jgi:hypothetical protein
MPIIPADEIFVIIPLFARPLRASVTIGREIRSRQLQALAGALRDYLHQLVPIVDVLKRAGWEVVAEETSLICRHPSVRTKLQAEVALAQLGVDYGWYRACDFNELERLFPQLVQEESSKEEAS